MPIWESHKGSTPLDGGESGQVTGGMEELGGCQRPQHHWSPGHIEPTCGKQKGQLTLSSLCIQGCVCTVDVTVYNDAGTALTRH